VRAVAMVFRVLIRGGNCLVELKGCVQRLGFYVTRFVEASAPDEAARCGIEVVHAELTKRPLLNAPSDDPTIKVEEVSEVEDPYWPNPGFSWYREAD